MKEFIFCLLLFPLCVTCGYWLHLWKKAKRGRISHTRTASAPPPFDVVKYLDRIESAAIQLWEDQEPLDDSITLWWGLDGLRKGGDGKLEWICRTKANRLKQITLANGVSVEIPSDMHVDPQGCVSFQENITDIFGDCYTTRKNLSYTRTSIADLRMSMLQLAQTQINQNMINQL